MEIRVERRFTGREYRDAILERYGTRRHLESQASEGDAEAQDHLADLELLEASPERLEAEVEIETVAEVGPDELARLSPARLRVLATVAEGDEEEPGGGPAPNLTELAERLGRDKKNVSEDVALLEDLGLVEAEKRGRETIPRTVGDEIHIVLDTRGGEPPGAGASEAPV